MPSRIVLLYVLFLVAVQAAEATPTIALAVSSITTPEETTSTPVEVTVFDTDTALSSLTVSVTDSSDTSIIRVSPADWSVSGNGTNSPTRQLTVTPRTNAVGTTLLRVEVSDGGRTAFAMLTVTVTNLNDPPVIVGLPTSDSTAEDIPYTKSFTISDPDSSTYTVALTSSQNPAIVAISDAAFTGTGSSRTVTITPKLNQSLATAFNLTFTVSDGSASSLHVLSFTVSPVDDPTAFTNSPLATVTHVLGQAPVALSGLASLLDPDTFSATGTKLEAKLVNVGGAGFTNPLAEDELVVLPAAGVGMNGSGPFNLTVPNGAGQRVIATATTLSASGSAALELAIAGTCTNEDLRLLPACIRYRNRLGTAGSTLTRRAEMRFVGSGPGSNGSGAKTQVDIVVSSTDPPSTRVLTDLLVAPLGSAILTPQCLETVNTDTITLSTAPQFGQLRKNGIALTVGGTTFDQTDIIAGRITYSHINANATFDQVGLRLTKGTLSTLVTVLVRVVPSLADYQIVSDPPMVIAAGGNHVLNLGILVPTGSTASNVWYALNQTGTCTLTFDQAAGSLTMNAAAAGEVSFLLCYGPTIGSTAPVAHQRVRLVVVPAGTMVLTGGGG